MCAPLRVVGETFGVIHLTSLEEDIFSEPDLALFSSFAQEAGLAVQRGRLYEQLAQEKERAEEANLLKSEFLATISHELRTPLNSIIGYTQCMLDGVDGMINAEQESDLSKVLNNAEKLLRLIDNILDLSRLELDYTELNYEVLDIPRLINDAVNTIQPLADAHRLEIKLDLCPLPLTIKNDAFRLQQVLNNLLSNAVKFTHQGWISIRTDLHTVPDSLTFVVSDTGVGFPEEAQEYIFERFRQADGSITRRYGGTGLGLSICKNLVELMGGKIWAESMPNQGSSFYFTIPLVNAALNQD
jgi:signal transduction histidine kinase